MDILNNYILQTNLFNFIILLSVFIFIAIKFDLKGMISSMQDKIAKNIFEVKENKLNSENALNNAKEAVKNLSVEVDKIKKDAEESANVISQNILEDAKKQAENISLNSDKVVLAEEKQLLSNLIKDISKASIEKSQENIINMLANNKDLHEKYINESIDKLDGLKL